ncbi:MAG: nucleotidyltransferase domain-containing protein [Sphingobacteriales bacterium]|nr:MAG: nucleotidyltransferase domain-containing protein [Sphingobacteriales bacterium]
MHDTEFLARLPAHVADIVQQLKEDMDSLEVWLIGSRATNTAHATSDWDLLLRSAREPEPVTHRCEGVDVLHCGPSGKILLEGQPRKREIKFTGFMWEAISPVEARYSGIQFLPVQEGVVRDSWDPSVVRFPAKALLLWHRF